MIAVARSYHVDVFFGLAALYKNHVSHVQLNDSDRWLVKLSSSLAKRSVVERIKRLLLHWLNWVRFPVDSNHRL